jgi:N-acetylglucosamine malate deacetylase 2
MNDTLPSLQHVLVVCAHPDDESFGLGAVLSTLADSGSRLSVLCFTHGEASTLHGVDGDLHTIRADELADAGDVLGVTHLELLDYPDGHLAAHPIDQLAGHVIRHARAVDAAALLVFDHGGITGHPDHQHATDAALAASTTLACPVLAWAIPDTVADRLNDEFHTTFAGQPDHEIDITITVDRARQLDAIGCHRSQSADNPVLCRRLELLGPTEYLRYLTPARQPSATTPSSSVEVKQAGGMFPCSQPLRDEHRALLPELAALRVAADAVGRPDGPEHAERARRLLAPTSSRTWSPRRRSCTPSSTASPAAIPPPPRCGATTTRSVDSPPYSINVATTGRMSSWAPRCMDSTLSCSAISRQKKRCATRSSTSASTVPRRPK